MNDKKKYFGIFWIVRKGILSDSNQVGGNSNSTNGTHGTSVKYQSLSPSKKIASLDNPLYS